MAEIVAVDIGGTHARFAIATIEAGQVVSVTREATLKAADYDSLTGAWAAYAERSGGALPRAAGIAVACPVEGEVLRLTNNPWVIRPATLPAELGVDRYTLVNDFGAVANAVARLEPSWFRHLCGPDRPLPDPGVISVVGPGTGLGVAILARDKTATRIIEAEGGHADFSPVDPIEDILLQGLRTRFVRVSIERIVSGPGLANIYQALARSEGHPAEPPDDATLWSRALSGGDPLAEAALERFCRCLGTAAGDIALTQGSQAVVIAGGLGLRLAERLPRSGFEARFLAKGRFQGRMAAMPVKIITYPEPGLFGAAAAFAIAHESGADEG